MADRSPQRGGFPFLLHGWKYDEWFLSKSLTPVHRSDNVLITERLQINDQEPFLNGQVARYLKEQRKDLGCREMWQELSMLCPKDISHVRDQRDFCAFGHLPQMGKQELQVCFCFYKQKPCGVRSMSDCTGNALVSPIPKTLGWGCWLG